MTPNAASPASGPVLEDTCKADGTAGVRFVGLDLLSQSQCRLITSDRWILSINWEDHRFCCVRSLFFFFAAYEIPESQMKTTAKDLSDHLVLERC